ncbi:hypothetical protein IWZ00DRAFT_151965 [Phyllosticta capitalensis]
MSSICELLAQNQPSFQTHQALIAIGLQNDFISSTGKLPVSKPDGLLPRIKKVVPAFRDHAGSIIWVRTESDPAQPLDDGSGDADAVITSVPGKGSSGDDDGGPDLMGAELQLSDLPSSRPRRSRRRPEDLLRRVTTRNQEDEIEASNNSSTEEELFLTNGSGICQKGGYGAAFADAISTEIKPNDIVVTKRWYSALRGTNLLLTLRARLITELFVCGCISNISVYATAAEAARHGITIYLIDDCIGYRKLDRHREAMKQMVEYMGAYLISFDDVMKRIMPNGQGEMSDQSTSKEGATPDDVNDIGHMLKNLNIKDNPGSGSASQHQPAERGSSSKRGIKIDRHASTNEATPERLLVSIGSSNPPRASNSNSGPTKPHIRMRRRTHASKSERSSDSKRESVETSSASQTSPTAKSTSAMSSSENSQNPSPRNSAPETAIISTSCSDRPPDTKHTRSSPKSRSPSQAIPRTGERPVKSKKPTALPTLGPTDAIGEGDSRILQHFLSDEVNAPGTTLPFQDSIFDKLCNEVRFQTMLHATGEVPRLVAVQGDVGSDGSIPIYRHPSDQSLPLLHFSPSVLLLRKHVERLVGHPMNHVLIQFYRRGEDYISEHSDKTLDIVRGSSIVNVSFGAQRTMRLRTKRSEKTKSDGESISSSRETQRVAMPHNSALILGPATNACWLHGIMPDKRLSNEKLPTETLHDGMRISLTFRHIGTFLSPDSRLIWGQGASSKHKADAAPVINGDEKVTEKIIRAFSIENLQTSETFDWDATYGAGFDVLHFSVVPPVLDAPILFLSTSYPQNRAVQLYANHLGIGCSTVNAVAPFDNSLAQSHRTRPRPPPIHFRDNDLFHTEVSAPVPILTYLERFCSRKSSDDEADSPEARRRAALSHQYLDLADDFFRTWDHGTKTGWERESHVDAITDFLAQAETLIEAEKDRRQRKRGDSSGEGEDEASCLLGRRIGAADCAIWACYEGVHADGRWDQRGCERLEAFWEGLRKMFVGDGDDGGSWSHSAQVESGSVREKADAQTGASDSLPSPSPPSSAAASPSASTSPTPKDKKERKGKQRKT